MTTKLLEGTLSCPVPYVMENKLPFSHMALPTWSVYSIPRSSQLQDECQHGPLAGVDLESMRNAMYERAQPLATKQAKWL